MILGIISLEPCISNRILLAALVVQNWDLSLVTLWGLVKTFITGWPRGYQDDPIFLLILLQLQNSFQDSQEQSWKNW